MGVYVECLGASESQGGVICSGMGGFLRYVAYKLASLFLTWLCFPTLILQSLIHMEHLSQLQFCHLSAF